MKKMILSLLMLVFAAFGTAQETSAPEAPATGTDASAVRSEWLPTFTSVVVNGAMDITFVRVPDTQAPKIEYDTKGSYTTKFRFEVKDRVLRISEKTDARRPARTSVRVSYNTLGAASISDAFALFDGTLAATMFDLTVGGTASVEAVLDVKDLLMDLSGRSNATLSGSVRYFTLTISTGSLFARKLETMSAQVSASSSGSAELWVTERLETRTTTGGKVAYWGEPAVVRGTVGFMGGDIKQLSE